MNELYEIGLRLGAGILVLAAALIVSLILKGIDRKFAAWLQARVGPPIRQPFWDVFKLFQKENVVPERAVPWAFNGAPLVAFLASLLLLFFVPLGPVDGVMEELGGLNPILGGYGDIILLIYLMAIPGLMMAIGGFASGSPLATVGAQREMVMMMSYEFPLAIVILAVVWRVSRLDAGIEAFNLGEIADPANALWDQSGMGPMGIIGLLLLAAVFFLIIPSELSKIPFDAPEAETEIGGGIIAEYSGTNLAMFYLSDSVKTLAFTALAVALFFPYNFSPVVGLDGWPAFAVDMAFWFIKIEVLYFLAVTVIRVGAARLKIDFMSWLYLIPLSVIAIVGTFLLYLDTIVG
ncbi:MAG: respiratory chain complex I subunit 1 family protein [Thermoplasmatota archaeon]